MRSITCTTLATSLASIALVPAVSATEFQVSVVAGHPPVFRWVRMIPESFVPALDAALEGSGYSIEVDGLYSGAIAGVGEELETVGAGLAEIGICNALFDPAKLALQNISYYTPFVTDDFELVGRIMDELHRDDPRMTAAYADNEVTYLGAPIVLDDYLLLTDFPVDSLDDLEGRKIAAPGAAVNWLSGTGAVGVAGNLTTYYNELRSGVYDGVLVFASAALPGKLHEVAPYVTHVGLGAQFAAALCANAGWYEGLPDTVRAALHEAADTANEWYRAELVRAVEDALATMSAEGATIGDAPEVMRRDWARRMDNVAREWSDELDARGLPASALLRDYMQAMRKAGATPVRDWDRE